MDRLPRSSPACGVTCKNHAIPEACAFRDMPHDGFAEMWFADFAALRRALQSSAWQAV